MKQQRFTQEFRDEAVRLVVSVGRRQAEVSRELGIGLSTLERWVASARARAVSAPGSETAEDEVKRLRRENAILREEREILKKATAFFASEARR
jgi:transposase